VHTDGIFAAARSTAPAAAYINLAAMDDLRARLAGVHHGKRQSIPNENLRQIKLRLLQPANRAEDPYIVAMLIALAQAQQKYSRRANGREFAATSFKVFLSPRNLSLCYSNQVSR
jgi:hypothetical protein